MSLAGRRVCQRDAHGNVAGYVGSIVFDREDHVEVRYPYQNSLRKVNKTHVGPGRLEILEDWQERARFWHEKHCAGSPCPECLKRRRAPQ